MLVFAYDGSLNGDWVAHYAVRFAANRGERKLRLVHLYEGSPEPNLHERIARIDRECGFIGVTLQVELGARGSTGVAERLLALVPPGGAVVAGTRARARDSAFLAGTVSAQLMEARGPPAHPDPGAGHGGPASRQEEGAGEEPERGRGAGLRRGDLH